MDTRRSRDLWTIVLAAGEGTRLQALTRALHGSELPKQFAKIHGDRSLLTATVDRASRWSDPDRTLVVVAAERAELARSQVPDSRVELVSQPKNLGTGPGVLLPLARIVARAPDAIVVIVPSDHFIRDEEPFRETIRKAEAVARADGSVVLVGAVPERAETQYGWIRTADMQGEISLRVAGFLEKPSLPFAKQLFDEGALWNTFIMVAPALALWELAVRELPHDTALYFERYLDAVDTESEALTRSAIYDELEPADFCKDILERANGLSVVPLAPCGWSDWGTPARVFRSLEGSADYATLVERVRVTSGRAAEPEWLQLTGT